MIFSSSSSSAISISPISLSLLDLAPDSCRFCSIETIIYVLKQVSNVFHCYQISYQFIISIRTIFIVVFVSLIPRVSRSIAISIITIIAIVIPITIRYIAIMITIQLETILIELACETKKMSSNKFHSAADCLK